MSTIQEFKSITAASRHLGSLIREETKHYSPARTSTSFIKQSLRTMKATESILKATKISRCPICTDDFELSEKLVKLPYCHHLFHRDCLVKWLNQKSTCPVCRNQLPRHPRFHCRSLRNGIKVVMSGQSGKVTFARVFKRGGMFRVCVDVVVNNRGRRRQ